MIRAPSVPWGSVQRGSPDVPVDVEPASLLTHEAAELVQAIGATGLLAPGDEFHERVPRPPPRGGEPRVQPAQAGRRRIERGGTGGGVPRREEIVRQPRTSALYRERIRRSASAPAGRRGRRASVHSIRRSGADVRRAGRGSGRGRVIRELWRLASLRAGRPGRGRIIYATQPQRVRGHRPAGSGGGSPGFSVPFLMSSPSYQQPLEHLHPALWRATARARPRGGACERLCGAGRPNRRGEAGRSEHSPSCCCPARAGRTATSRAGVDARECRRPRPAA